MIRITLSDIYNFDNSIGIMDIYSKTIPQTKNQNGNRRDKHVYARFHSLPIFKKYSESSNKNAIKKIDRSLSESSPFTRFQRRKYMVFTHISPHDQNYEDVFEELETNFPEVGLDVTRGFNVLKRKVSGFFSSKTPICNSLPTQPERHTYMVRCF